MIDFQEFPKIPRYSRDAIVTEKIDGSCGQILIDPVVGSAIEYETLNGIPLLYGVEK